MVEPKKVKEEVSRRKYETTKNTRDRRKYRSRKFKILRGIRDKSLEMN